MSDSELSEKSPVLVVINIHAAAFPRETVTDDGSSYVSYFRGSSGDQWLFVHDLERNESYLTGGDVAWEIRRVTGGDLPIHDLVLEREETMWLRACWEATRGSTRGVASR